MLRYKSNSCIKTDLPSLRSTVFRSGNSQAVRIPAALRLDCNEVLIRRQGSGLLIEPKSRSGWPAGYFEALEPGSTLKRPPQPLMPPARSWDEGATR